MPGDDAFTDSFTVPIRPEAAFALFVDSPASWWPAEASLSEETFASIAIEKAPGGRLLEKDRHGNTLVLGRVLLIERPTRISLSWHVTADGGLQPTATDASRLRISFHPSGTGGATDVRFVHQNLANQPDWGQHLADRSAPGGWPLVLDRYRTACAALRNEKDAG
jgi:uncharacterized protein YndB with AHSA1/START domain